jgi:hypothetical protein
VRDDPSRIAGDGSSWWTSDQGLEPVSASSPMRFYSLTLRLLGPSLHSPTQSLRPLFRLIEPILLSWLGGVAGRSHDP